MIGELSFKSYKEVEKLKIKKKKTNCKVVAVIIDFTSCQTQLSSVLKKETGWKAVDTKTGKTLSYQSFLEDPCKKFELMVKNLKEEYTNATIFAGIPRGGKFHLRAPLYLTFAKDIEKGPERVIWWTDEQGGEASRSGQSSSKAKVWTPAQRRIWGLIRQAHRSLEKQRAIESERLAPKTLVDLTSDEDSDMSDDEEDVKE